MQTPQPPLSKTGKWVVGVLLALGILSCLFWLLPLILVGVGVAGQAAKGGR